MLSRRPPPASLFVHSVVCSCSLALTRPFALSCSISFLRLLHQGLIELLLSSAQRASYRRARASSPLALRAFASVRIFARSFMLSCPFAIASSMLLLLLVSCCTAFDSTGTFACALAHAPSLALSPVRPLYPACPCSPSKDHAFGHDTNRPCLRARLTMTTHSNHNDCETTTKRLPHERRTTTKRLPTATNDHN